MPLLFVMSFSPGGGPFPSKGGASRRVPSFALALSAASMPSTAAWRPPSKSSSLNLSRILASTDSRLAAVNAFFAVPVSACMRR